MIIPIRCFSCGKPVGHLWEKYLEQINAGEDPKKVMDDLDIERYCCRALFMGHVDMLEDIAQFKKF
ncbi:DNA-directed RNA polymerase subunit N [Candidatus Woesearchaeota archaeon]|jgi:DNA-directed RNA polymerase subunit N (RpoN/RPB10)|nr:DNA-directed RNA polymerase subunit N [Candidatus Woesearchaeota archaeon]MBT4835564.1 DNA-directed RNA polymerase subunit N [Candidatus Woesearchaeota archaeon]MBT6734946.1 DNA-directed RNA polymerase subunit N [Candidatus Woesearchaeota archaeon]MBT7169757.1 DNA-directed RNA polymerase subunit N [Candidatus Woesearchaeota archaeon]MBT7474421.1 DNA-directed RNA polymerase subunit N [Candidatus Woesearchaeota archaeon]